MLTHLIIWKYWIAQIKAERYNRPLHDDDFTTHHYAALRRDRGRLAF